MECSSCHKAFHRGCCLGAPKSGDSHVTSSKWRCTQCVKCTTCGKTASTDVSSASTLLTTADESSFLFQLHFLLHVILFTSPSPPLSSPPSPLPSLLSPPLPFLPLQDHPTLWYDAFTCCADCNQLRNKGNFCPVCKEAYTDNDYESKMIQCAGCFHWVHAHCEDMTGEEPPALGGGGGEECSISLQPFTGEGV